MNRNRTIATVAATTGIFAATVVAGISILQASVATDPVSELPVLTAQTESTPSGSDLTFTPAPLPELPTVQPSASGSSAASTTPVANTTVSRADAQSVVLAATKGTVTSVKKVTRSGLPAFAVTVERSDGSVITGYVDAATGTAFDWVINKKAPAPAATYNDDDHDEEDDREYEEEEDDERNEYEGDEDDD